MKKGNFIIIYGSVIFLLIAFDISAMDYYTAGGGASCSTERPGSNSCSNKGGMYSSSSFIIKIIS